MDAGCSGIRIMGQSVRRKRNMDTTGSSIGNLDAAIERPDSPKGIRVDYGSQRSN